MKTHLWFGVRRLIIMLLLLGSCAKLEEQPMPPSTISDSNLKSEDILLWQQLFQNKGYNKQLSQPTTKGATRNSWSWTPQWNKAIEKNISGAPSSAYITLLPRQADSQIITLIGAKKYLVVTPSSSGWIFSIATYLYDERKGGSREQATENYEPAIDASYSGVILLQDLATGKLLRTHHQGNVNQTQESALSKQATVSTAPYTSNSTSSCHTYYTCEWTGYGGYCYGGGTTVYGTVTNTVDVGCIEPDGTHPRCAGEVFWQLDRSHEDLVCSPDGGGTGGGGSSPGSGSTSPCGTLVSNGQNQQIKDELNKLKALVTDNKEHGLGVSYDQAGNPVFSPFVGQSGTSGIDFTVTNCCLASLTHTHYTGLLSIFSGADIKGMAYMYTNGNTTGASNFTMNLITANGTVYALAITDTQAFNDFISSTLNNATSYNAFEFSYANLYGISSSQTVAHNEKAFLQMLTQAKTGLTLYKGDPNNFGSWQKLSYDNNNNVQSSTPCL